MYLIHNFGKRERIEPKGSNAAAMAAATRGCGI
jgi:hypothetical protein